MTDSGRPGASLPTHIGKYEVLRVLGRGAMGVVYHAHDPLLDRDVALKVMLPQTAADPDQKARFEREARAAAKIVHRNVLTVFDLGYHQDGSPYIAMEMLKGKDLLQTMREDAPLPLDQKLNVVVQLLDGLAHAHEAGVVHRDIKPANVFLVSDGTVKIMDFGVARFTMSSATNTGMVMGTPDYMSPEQVSGAKVDGRTDLWSAGCVLHELITGRRPFAADSLMTIFYRITHDTPDPRAAGGGAFRPAAPRGAPRPHPRGRGPLSHRVGVRGRPAPDPEGAAAGGRQTGEARRDGGRLRARDLGPPVETTEHALDLLDALADEEMNALASALRRGPPVVKPAAPEPPPATVEKIVKPADPTPLFQLLRDIVAQGKTGNLHFSQGEERRSLFFVRGNILYGSTNVEGEHLGHILVRYGFIDQATLERVVPIVLKERKRLGGLLREMGILTAARVDEGIGLHVRDILFDMVDRGEGQFSFEDVVMDGADITVPVSTEQIILEAARRLQAPGRRGQDPGRPRPPAGHVRPRAGGGAEADPEPDRRLPPLAHRRRPDRARDLQDHPAAAGGRGAQPLRAAVHGDGGVRDAHGTASRPPGETGGRGHGPSGRGVAAAGRPPAPPSRRRAARCASRSAAASRRRPAGRSRIAEARASVDVAEQLLAEQRPRTRSRRWAPRSSSPRRREHPRAPRRWLAPT